MLITMSKKSLINLSFSDDCREVLVWSQSIRSIITTVFSPQNQCLLIIFDRVNDHDKASRFFLTFPLHTKAMVSDERCGRCLSSSLIYISRKVCRSCLPSFTPTPWVFVGGATFQPSHHVSTCSAFHQSFEPGYNVLQGLVMYYLGLFVVYAHLGREVPLILSEVSKT